MSEQHYGPGEELLWKYLMGGCTEAERKFVEMEIQNNPQIRDKLSRLQILFKSSHAEDENGISQNEEITFREDKDNFPVAKVLVLLLLVVLLLAVFSYLKSALQMTP